MARPEEPDRDGRRLRRLGPYELVRELGRGGFAEVWLAKRTGPGGFESRVAIKTVRLELRTDPAFSKMFLDEAKLAARINHPNVVNIFELGEADDVLYLVMEYVAGRPLNVLGHMMRRAGKPIPPGIVMKILADTCAGLHAAHELEREGKSLGVIHRDVSPQNILVSDKGIVKLIDFGVAKANDRLAADTTDGHTKGKLRYMAPEQAMAKPVDRRVDVWAAGAVAFDLIEGHPPYDGHNDLARLFRLMSASPPPSMSEGVPAPLAEVIRRALQPDPAARWQTAAEMRAAIESALDACGLRITSDTVTEFFGAALTSAADDDRDGETASEGGVLRDRLKRPSMRAAMATIDVPAPDGASSASSAWKAADGAAANDEPTVETLSALDTSPRGVPRRGLRGPRNVALALVLAATLLIGVLALARRPEDGGAAVSATPAAGQPPAASADPRSAGAAESAATTAPGAAGAAGAVADPQAPTDPASAAPSFVIPAAPASASALAASPVDRKRPPPPSPARTSRPRNSRPGAGTLPGARPRYDDTIQ